MNIFVCEKKKAIIESSIGYLKKWGLGGIVLRPCPIKKRVELGEKFACIRTIRPEERRLNEIPLPMEIKFEEKRLSSCSCGKGVVYDAHFYSGLLRDRFFTFSIPWLKERPVFVTLDYIASFEENDKRYHLRYAIFNFPVVISLPGIVEAPAKPREFYIYRSMGIPLDDETRKDHLWGLEDPRFPRVLAGILLQAWFFYETGDPFCPDPHCSLFNAHWQKDLLAAQEDEPYILCRKHYHILRGRL